MARLFRMSQLMFRILNGVLRSSARYTSQEERRMVDRHTSVQSVDRTFDILEAMADAGGETGLSELSERLSLPIPTLHRLLRTLVAGGYARQLPSRKYALGPRLTRLGEVATQLTGTWARPILTGVVDALGETANMATLDGEMVIYVAQVPSPHSMRMFTEVGRRVLMHCTGVGKAILAGLPDAKVKAVVGHTGLPARTEKTITDLDALLAELDRIRERGYAIDDEEQELGVRCFTVAVPGAAVPTAISVSGPTVRMTAELRERAVPLLRAAAERLAEELT
jgi:IclR family acetate operon transcriptional repressor